MKRFVSLLILVCSLLFQSCSSQGLDAVYAGVTTSIGAMGGGMLRDDVTILFRKDGTFTEKLKEADWQTRVDGKYVKKGSELELSYEGRDKKKTFKVNSNGTLTTHSGHILIKMDDSEVIPGNYRFTYASSSGGVGTGQAYIGASGGQNIFFDGKGKFTRDGYGGVVIAGDGVGGGTSRKDDETAGTYTLENGLLTMKNSDGSTEKHSFFVSNTGKSVMAVLDGKIFFRESDEEAATNKRRKEEKETGKASFTAPQLAARIREAHGDNAIDKIKTLKVTAKMDKLDLVAITDFERQWTRTEIHHDGKLLAVEQLEGDKGWSWANGKKTALDASRVKQMQSSYNSGLGLLQSSRIAALESGTVEPWRSGYKVTYNAAGVNHVLHVNDKFMVVEEKKTSNGSTTEVRSSDFREVAGVQLAFTERQSDSKNAVTIKISDYAVNTGKAADWKEME